MLALIAAPCCFDGTLGPRKHSHLQPRSRGSWRIPNMIRHLLIGVAACAIAAMSTLSASAMPRVAAETLVAGSDSPVILARGGHGHGHGHMGRGGHGHHYGWSRGRHRGWR